MAPNASLLITMWDPRHEWIIVRLTGWETRKPEIESLHIPVNLPDFGAGCPEQNNTLIDPNGHYLVVRAPEVNIGENGSDKQKWETILSVVDLSTFKVVNNVTATGGLAGGHLFFSNGGTLMLHTASKLGSPLPFAVTVFDLPMVDRLATCDFEEKPGSGVTKSGENCKAVMQAAQLADIQDMGDLPAVDDATEKLAGPDCDFVTAPTRKDLALYRCGKEHFGDPYGDFGIIFWHALKVLSIPDGNTIFSLPLHIHDSTSSGIFAIKNGREYLIVHHGSKLLTYEIPSRVAVNTEDPALKEPDFTGCGKTQPEPPF